MVNSNVRFELLQKVVQYEKNTVQSLEQFVKKFRIVPKYLPVDMSEVIPKHKLHILTFKRYM